MFTCAPSPFDHPKADIILRSSDGIDFYVFKLLLSLASPFFEVMFELPQPAVGTNDSDDTKDGLPVIPVQEDSRTLDLFLRFCYPSTLAEDPSLEDLTDIPAVLGAARKYSLDLIERKVCQALVNPKLLEAEPLRCFAIAKNAGLEEETLTAARYTLRQPLVPGLFAEIELISASDLLALLTYHKKCSIAVGALLDNLSWLREHWNNSNAGCRWTDHGMYVSNKRKTPECSCERGSSTRFMLWQTAPVALWATYMAEIFEMLKDCPYGGNVRAKEGKTIQKAISGGCITCVSLAKGTMEEFNNLLALKVEEAIAPIRLEMDF